jgi:hypothetical protein
MTRRKAATGMPTGQKVTHADASKSTPDTRLLDASIGILRNTGKAARAKGTTFSLQVGSTEGILQGPRGKTVAVFDGTPAQQKAQAEEYAKRLGQTLTIYD